ncbi:glycosyltransferase family 4 protein [Haloferax gibbonsii]|uniref:glycosyltransferase family 4 protein n=1 Tax=Haloferax gibbonsii TaxID=35746 RepID=UPI0009E45C11|nr:glycosyltransferase family 1 protein [Haloferax gibbonsii]
MKIGVNARTFSVNEPDGAVQASRKLISSLGEKEDVDLILFGNKDLSRDDLNHETTSSNLFMSDSPFFGIAWERLILPALANNSDIDILFCPNGNAPPIGVNCPIVTTIHDVNAIKGMSGGIHRIYRRISIPLSVRSSEAIVTVSNFSKSEIKNNLSIGSDKIHVNYNGVDDFFLSDASSVPLDLPDNYLLYVGAMNPRKNISRLIDAYRKSRNKIDQKLVLIGPNNKLVYKNMDTSNFSDEIVTPGFIPKEQLKFAYENADVFIYPSLYEGFGMPPLEAMACGTPVISSNRSSLPEILNGYSTLVDPTNVHDIASAIVDVATSDITSQDQAKLKSHAEQYSWENAADRMYDIFQDVLNSTV